jgi:nitrite transporter
VPIPVNDALDAHESAAVTKARQARLEMPKYAVSSMLAGGYIGVAVVLLVMVSSAFASAKSPATKLVQGSVFGVALTLVVFAGAELFTGNNMVMLIGWLRGGVSGGAALLVNLASLIGNFVGSVALAAIVHWSGVLDTAPPGKKPAGEAMITTLVTNKMHATDGQLFWRALLCNALVCLGLWMATRTRSDGAKLAVLFWALLAFIASGFEHSVANMTIFSLAVFNNAADWSDLGHNLLLTVPGNIVGGALVVGLPYAFSARPKRPTPAAVKPSPAGVREPASALA